MIEEGIHQTQRVYIIPFNLVVPANWITFHSLRDEDEDVGQTELKTFFFSGSQEFVILSIKRRKT